MKITTLTKSNLNIAGILNPKSKSEPGFIVDKHSTVANNGKIQIKITRPEIDSEELPKMNIEAEESAPFMMDTRKALVISKKIPKCVNNVLSQAIVYQETDNVKIACTDLETEQITYVPILESQPFDHKTVTPVSSYKKFRIAFNPELLGQICKYAMEFQDEYDKRMYLEFTDESSGVKITTRNSDTKQDFEAVIMPIHLWTEAEENALASNNESEDEK